MKTFPIIMFTLIAIHANSSLALDCSGINPWLSDDVYLGGAQVQHNDNAYTANYWSQGNNPETHSANPWDRWTLNDTCEGSPTSNEFPIANANGPYSGKTDVAVNFSSNNSEDPDGVVSTYLWRFGDGSSSTHPNPSHIYNAPGSYSITLTITDNNGASRSATTSAIVTDADGEPTPNACADLAQYVAGSSYASGDSVFNRRNTDNKNVEYMCDIAGWCSLNSPLHYEPGNGTAWDDAWNEIGLCNGDGDPTNEAPKAEANGPYSSELAAAISFSSAGSVDPEGEVLEYLWTFGDGESSAEANPVHIYSNTGNYTVELVVTDVEGMSTSDTATAVVTSSSSIATPNPIPQVGGGYSMTRANVEAVESSLTSGPLFQEVKDSIVTRDNSTVEAVVPGRQANPENVRRVEALLNSDQWDFLFALRDSSYSYTNFLQSVAKFEALCKTYTDGRNSNAICAKSLATMFAHFTQETGAHNPSSPIEEWRQGLFYLRELGCTEEGPGCGYNAECYPGSWQSEAWPCGINPDNSFKKYFGRGAKQLSYNYNYGPFSQAMFGDVRVLLDEPDRVASTWLNLASAVFFFVYPQPPKPSMLHVIDGTWQPNAHDLSLSLTPSFGVTTNIINGGIECGKGTEVPQSKNRIEYYRHHAQALSVDIPASEQLGCASSGKFDAQGAAAMNIYWEQDWQYYSDRPEGLAFACQLVNYQTEFNALLSGDYEKCVTRYFDVEISP